MIHACPKCVAEKGPRAGHPDALTAAEGGATCRYHGFLSEAEIHRLFSRPAAPKKAHK